jgi:anaerobic selenocysteine-containing dehydrogenase
MVDQIYSHCRGCLSSCGLVFEVEHGEIVSTRADPDSLVSHGFKCIKGDMSVEFLRGSEARFTQSMRRGPGGSLTPIPSDRLMDEVAEAIARSQRLHGPRSVALYIGTAAYRKSFNVSLAKQLMAAIGSPSVFSTMTIDQSAHWVVDGRMGVFATGRPNFADVDVAVVTGANPVISHSSSFLPVPIVGQVPRMRDFRTRGGKLIVVDPRKTETARLADLHIQPQPGHDAEIFAALNRLMLEKGWCDEDFCTRFVADREALRTAVAPFTPELVAGRAGIDANQLLEAAHLIGQARKLWAGFGTGLSMSPNPNTAGHMVEALNALRGGYMRAGDVIRNPGVFVKRAAVEGVKAPRRSWETEPKLGGGFGRLYGEFPSSQLASEILTPGPNRIRTLIVVGANPLMAFGEPDRLRAAFEDLECLVVIEPRATETTDLAHYIVAPPLQYETADFNLANSSRIEEPVVQYTPAVTPPPPGVLDEWEFFNGLANRLGHVLRVSPGAYHFDPGKASSARTIDPNETWTADRLIEEAFAAVGLSLEEVRRHPHGFKVEAPPQRVAPPPADDGARLDLCPPDVARELAEILARPSAAGPDYRLVNRRIIELMNSEFRLAETVQRRFDGASPLYMHPEDMAVEGFAAGDRIIIEGRHGEISARARPDATLRRGVVAMTHCWSGEAVDPAGHGHVSRLVSMRARDVQQIDGMPQQSSLPVTLRRGGEGQVPRSRAAFEPARQSA